MIAHAHAGPPIAVCGRLALQWKMIPGKPSTVHASTCNLLVQTWRLPLPWMRCLKMDTVRTRNSCSALQHLSSFRPLPWQATLAGS